MSFYLLAWIANLAFGLETVTGKLLSRYVLKNPWHFAFTWELFVTILIIPVALYEGVALPAQYGNLLIASFLSGLGSVPWVVSPFKLEVTHLSRLFGF